MIYPKHLLPQPNYRKPILDSDIPNNACFIRWTYKNRQIKTLRGLRKNIGLHIDKGCIYNGISCYLYSVMRKPDFQYKPSTDDSLHYDSPWNPGESPIIPVAPNIERIENRGYFCLRANKIRAFESRIVFNANNVNQRIEKATLRLEHAPNYSNYWHFDIHVWSCGLNSGDIPYRLRDKVSGGNDKAKAKTFRKYMVGIMEDIDKIVLPEKSAQRIYLTKSKYIDSVL